MQIKIGCLLVSSLIFRKLYVVWCGALGMDAFVMMRRDTSSGCFLAIIKTRVVTMFQHEKCFSHIMMGTGEGKRQGKEFVFEYQANCVCVACRNLPLCLSCVNQTCTRGSRMEG